MFYSVITPATIPDMRGRIGFWKRSAAFAIDMTLVCAVWLAIMMLLVPAAQHSSEQDRVASIVFYTLALAYWLTFELWFAATLGKLLLGLQIGLANGQRADRWTLFLRWSARMYPVIFSLIAVTTLPWIWEVLGGLGLWFVLIGCFHASNDWKQAWHDEWAHTAVYRRKDLIASDAQMLHGPLVGADRR